MTREIRWGIIGAGWIAACFASDLRFASTGVLSRVASRDERRAISLAKRFGARTAPSYEALVTADDVDAVYVATPTSLHRDHCLLALQHGKPVLCEKPLAASVAHAKEIRQAAIDAETFCMEGMWSRFLPSVVRLRQCVRDGDVGAISHLSAQLGFPVVESDATAAITSSRLGGGALYDLGVYGVSMAYHLLGPPDEVSAVGSHSEMGNLRDVAILMTHERGSQRALSSILASHSTALRNTLDMSGTTERLTLDAPFIQSQKLRARAVSPDRREETASSAIKDYFRGTPIWTVARSLAHFRQERRTIDPFRGYGLWFEADEVAKCLREEKQESTIMPLAESVDVLRTLERVQSILAPTNTTELAAANELGGIGSGM